ncbi:hypothetical protein ABIA31_007985 [Catenulispora sp. MAP5-51]|uniref:hypothetical protein n=1 Tax=Catenulispora sp. MAP5-51 TaxID=3156298 RepID=UPI003517186F
MVTQLVVGPPTTPVLETFPASVGPDLAFSVRACLGAVNAQCWAGGSCLHWFEEGVLDVHPGSDRIARSNGIINCLSVVARILLAAVCLWRERRVIVTFRFCSFQPAVDQAGRRRYGGERRPWR